MAKMKASALRRRDADRKIGEELLEAVREMKVGKVGHLHRVHVTDVAAVRTRAGIS